MRTYEVRVESDGSVVLPPELRKLLHIRENRRIRFTLDGNGVRMSVVRSPYTVAEVLGSIPGNPGMSVDLDDEIEEAMADALAEKYESPVNR